jgi:hypothetical protein
MVEGGGFEPPNPKEQIYSLPRLASSLPLHNYNHKTHGGADGISTRMDALGSALHQDDVLLAELPLGFEAQGTIYYGGADGIRTRDLLRDRQAC